jgi:hypothetical protein
MPGSIQKSLSKELSNYAHRRGVCQPVVANINVKPCNDAKTLVTLPHGDAKNPASFLDL